MGRSLFYAVVLTPCIAFICAAQSSGSTSQQDSSQAQSQAQNTSVATSQASVLPTDTKKTKKVWTNENLSGSGGTISVVGNPKGNSKTGSGSGKSVDANYIANTKKQLEKYQEEMSDLEKQIAQLKSFSQGETSLSSGAVKINKSYNRDPIDVQMRELQAKKDQTQEKYDALLDEARKKGVEPGQLR
jgi:hypothetical protein